MNPEEIRLFLHAQPFVPFRIHLSDGHDYLIRHPELVMLGTRVAILGVPSMEDASLFASWQVVAYIHLVRLSVEEPQPDTGQVA